jgi:hypothetical protein
MVKLRAVLLTVPLIVIVSSVETAEIPLKVSDESAGLPERSVR